MDPTHVLSQQAHSPPASNPNSNTTDKDIARRRRQHLTARTEDDAVA
jgi:hypothetical protein